MSDDHNCPRCHKMSRQALCRAWGAAEVVVGTVEIVLDPTKKKAFSNEKHLQNSLYGYIHRHCIHGLDVRCELDRKIRGN